MNFETFFWNQNISKFLVDEKFPEPNPVQTASCRVLEKYLIHELMNHIIPRFVCPHIMLKAYRMDIISVRLLTFVIRLHTLNWAENQVWGGVFSTHTKARRA